VLVIILGVLIVLGVIGLIVGFVLRLRAPDPGRPFAATVVAPGERIESVQMDGNRILLRLSGANGEELVIMDSGGRMLGRIAIDAKP